MDKKPEALTEIETSEEDNSPYNLINKIMEDLHHYKTSSLSDFKNEKEYLNYKINHLVSAIQSSLEKDWDYNSHQEVYELSNSYLSELESSGKPSSYIILDHELIIENNGNVCIIDFNAADIKIIRPGEEFEFRGETHTAGPDILKTVDMQIYDNEKFEFSHREVDAEQQKAIDTLNSKYAYHSYASFINNLVSDSSRFDQIKNEELVAGLMAGNTVYEIVNKYYEQKTADNILEYIGELNSALLFNEIAYAHTREDVLDLMEKGYGFSWSKVKEIHEKGINNRHTDPRAIIAEILNEQNIKHFADLSWTGLFIQIDDKLIDYNNNKIMLPNEEFEYKGVAFENTSNVLEVMHWQFIGDFNISTNYESSVSNPAVEQHVDLKNNIIEEMHHHLETLNEFIEEHYPAAVIIAPPALAEFVDDMAGYSFVHSNQEFDGVEFVDIWNHYEDYYTKTPTPLLAAVMEDLSENHDTRAYDIETTLERALNMVEGAEPEPEPETPKAKPRNKMKI